jgi:hypothetical protein
MTDYYNTNEFKEYLHNIVSAGINAVLDKYGTLSGLIYLGSPTTKESR